MWNIRLCCSRYETINQLIHHSIFQTFNLPYGILQVLLSIFLPIELYGGSPFTDKCDIYSMGIILWEVFSRVIRGKHEAPYAEYTYLKMDYQVFFHAAKKDLRPTIPPTCNEALAGTLPISNDIKILISWIENRTVLLLSDLNNTYVYIAIFL